MVRLREGSREHQQLGPYAVVDPRDRRIVASGTLADLQAGCGVEKVGQLFSLVTEPWRQ